MKNSFKMLGVHSKILILFKCLLLTSFKILTLNKYLISFTLRDCFLSLITVILLTHQIPFAYAVIDPSFIGFSNESTYGGKSDQIFHNKKNAESMKISTSLGSSITPNGYLDKLDNLERSVAAVLIKVAYGTTSTTKRSIPDNTHATSLTTIATPLLTTLRYFEKFSEQQQINVLHRSYELDLERDHALPTSAPNADILKSNSNPTYPNPNRHYNHDRDRHQNVFNSTPLPSLPNTKKNNIHAPSFTIYPGEMPQYSPPARSFFTPPLPPEYQNPFADKPTLRGTSNEGVVANTGAYINRRPIPPPSLMPGHERIPLRPPDLAASTGGIVSSNTAENSLISTVDLDRKKALNTPSRGKDENKNYLEIPGVSSQQEQLLGGLKNPTSSSYNAHKEVLPSIRRILSGANGKKGDIPEVLLKQVTSRPFVTQYQSSSSPIVFIDSTSQVYEHENISNSGSNINKSKSGNENEKTDKVEKDNLSPNEKQHSKTKVKIKPSDFTKEGYYAENNNVNSTPSAAAAVGDIVAAIITSTSSTNNVTDLNSPNESSASSSSSSATAAATATATWNIAWNIHVYLSIILFTILAVYSLYKILIYNKLTHLFTQSYFLSVHLTLVTICIARIFYLCYDAYNIHSSFHMFTSELLLNLPAAFLTISFSILILFLFLKSLNHKNNRYSALIRPLTVIVGSGVHVVLCITLHYVESYTMKNHHHLYYQQQQLYRRQQYLSNQYWATNIISPSLSNIHVTNSGNIASIPPPRVLALICQIIYIFICLSLGTLYLYIYRVLKRILRNKSQNYIHGYQNLSYAIHITIATALLFILLAALHIFGAISISTSKSLLSPVTTDVDWLQWGYQFSLRLIEAAIITLISWVAGLKTSVSGVNIGMTNGEPHISGSNTVATSTESGGNTLFGPGVNRREKQSSRQTNIAGYFFPCTSSSSQEQFETDYPVVCNTNTNLHTYTMRTGKLIYDDSFALNSLASQSSQVIGNNRDADLQLQSAYQRPYDTNSLNQNILEYPSQIAMSRGEIDNQFHQDSHKFTDYITDSNTDHYENPNFDLQNSTSAAAINTLQFNKNSSTSTTASSSRGSGSSQVSQQQILLQNESCYSEPMQQSSTADFKYDFTNFERPKFSGGQPSREFWLDHKNMKSSRFVDRRDKKTNSILDCSNFEQSERRSANTNHFCSNNGRPGAYNTFEHKPLNCFRKSGTLNNIIGGDKNSLVSPTSSKMLSSNQRSLGAQTLGSGDKQQLCRNNRGLPRGTSIGVGITAKQQNDFSFKRSSLERTKNCTRQDSSQGTDSDIMSSDGNVERSNLINNDSSCARDKNDSVEQGNMNNITGQNKTYSSCVNSTADSSNSGTVLASENANSNTMLVADHGFVRFRALDDINNAQGVGIHNATVRTTNRKNSYLKASG